MHCLLNSKMYLLKNQLYFPPVENTHSSGIIAFGGDLSVERLLLAYKNGIFPWYDDSEPITWWCPEYRMVVIPKEYKPSKSLRNILNRGKFKITFNQNFEEVIKNCQSIERNGQNGTWISDEIVEAYLKLHHLGYAKSVEVWENEELVGGLYGVDLGNKIFYGESMFSKVSNASKIAFTWLNNYLKEQSYLLLDCQVYNDHLASLGAFEIERKVFMELLQYSNSTNL